MGHVEAGGPTRGQAWLSWSSGKDSVFSLHAVRRDPEIEVVGLLTTVNGEAQRVAMHAVRRTLVEVQAARVGLPLHVVELPAPCPNEEYEARMRTALESAAAGGVDHMVFGDVFLADVRAYRERLHSSMAMRPYFPLWHRPTAWLAREMIDVGIRAVVTCVDPRRVTADLVGRAFDEAFLAALPTDVDPLGEHGEFHTFVWDAPAFEHPIPIEVGEVVERDGLRFCDVRASGEERP